MLEECENKGSEIKISSNTCEEEISTVESEQSGFAACRILRNAWLA